MLVSEVITRVRAIAGDVDVLQFSDADCIRWINDGMRECAIDNELLQVTATSNTVVGTAAYPLPTDIAKLHSVKYDDTKIPVLTQQEFDEAYSSDGTETGTPIVATMWASNLTLYPAPDAVKELAINYVKQPTEVTAVGNDLADSLPVGYHRRLVDYCLAMVAEQDDDLTRYQLKIDEFRSGVQSLKDNHRESIDLYPSVSVDARDMGDGYWDYYGEY